MKAPELRKLTADELAARVVEERKRLFDLRFKKATGQLENASSLRQARRDLARALTIARERRASA
jgi:large subunit ribosomal protein L29